MLTKFPAHEITASGLAESPAVAQFSNQKLPLESIKYEKVWTLLQVEKKEQTGLMLCLAGDKYYTGLTTLRKLLNSSIVQLTISF